MSVSLTADTSADTVTTTPHDTASITGTNELLIAIALGDASGVTPTLSGRSQTWAQVGTTVSFGGSNNRLSLWKGTGSGSDGAVTIGFGTAATLAYLVTKVDGQNTGINWVVQAVTGTGTDGSLEATLAAFASATNATFSIGAFDDNAGITAGTGFTELDEETQVFFGLTLQSQWRVDADTSPECTVTGGGNQSWGFLAIEISELAASTAFTPIVGGFGPGMGLAGSGGLAG